MVESLKFCLAEKQEDYEDLEKDIMKRDDDIAEMDLKLKHENLRH